MGVNLKKKKKTEVCNLVNVVGNFEHSGFDLLHALPKFLKLENKVNNCLFISHYSDNK